MGIKHVFCKNNFLRTISLTHSPFSALRFLQTMSWRGAVPILGENITFCVADSIFLEQENKHFAKDMNLFTTIPAKPRKLSCLCYLYNNVLTSLCRTFIENINVSLLCAEALKYCITKDICITNTMIVSEDQAISRAQLMQ